MQVEHEGGIWHRCEVYVGSVSTKHQNKICMLIPTIKELKVKRFAELYEKTIGVYKYKERSGGP